MSLPGIPEFKQLFKLVQQRIGRSDELDSEPGLLVAHFVDEELFFLYPVKRLDSGRVELNRRLADDGRRPSVLKELYAHEEPMAIDFYYHQTSTFDVAVNLANRIKVTSLDRQKILNKVVNDPLTGEIVGIRVSTGQQKPGRGGIGRKCIAEGIEYDSITAAAEALKRSPTYVAKRIAEGVPGYAYSDGQPVSRRTTSGKSPRLGVAIRINDVVYPSIIEAAGVLGIPSATIRKRLSSPTFAAWTYA